MFDFVQHQKRLSGFLEFTGTYDDVFGNTDDVPRKLVMEIEQAVHGKPPANFEPLLVSGQVKS
jgi:hypothetical protein